MKYTPELPAQEIPYGYCHCGCGQKTELVPANCKTRNLVRGQPFTFIHGHNSRRSWATRFWKYVSVGSTDECWRWKGSTDKKGYGRLSISSYPYHAHCLSYQLHIGAVPKGLFVLHSCNNPACVNPKHLRLGTNKDNMKDMVLAGHSTRGEKAHAAKLTEEQVIEIRRLHAFGALGYRRLAKQFGVSRSAIRSIVLRLNWKHVP